MTEKHIPDPWNIPWDIQGNKGIVLDEGPVAHYVAAAYGQDFDYHTRCGKRISNGDKYNCKIQSRCETPICQDCMVDKIASIQETN